MTAMKTLLKEGLQLPWNSLWMPCESFIEQFYLRVLTSNILLYYFALYVSESLCFSLNIWATYEIMIKTTLQQENNDNTPMIVSHCLWLGTYLSHKPVLNSLRPNNNSPSFVNMQTNPDMSHVSFSFTEMSHCTLSCYTHSHPLWERGPFPILTLYRWNNKSLMWRVLPNIGPPHP